MCLYACVCVDWLFVLLCMCLFAYVFNAGFAFVCLVGGLVV